MYTNTQQHSVTKEEINSLVFQMKEVLINDEERNNRRYDLHKAMILGNAYHYKVRIQFETADDMKWVETTVWYATDSFVMLKGGISIPVRCIREVKF